MGIVAFEHQFGVPLHAEYLRVVPHDDRFDEPIWRVRHRDQLGRYVSNGLVVERVYAEIIVAENRQWGGVDCRQLVSDCRILQASLVLAMSDLRCAWMLGGDILNKCSTERDVHDLDAAANTEGWDSASQCGIE
jgi:hypothetical protein